MNINGLSDAEVIARLCQRIKSARIQQHLSQVNLAERSGLGVATIKRIEMGESITLQTLISILRALGKLNQLDDILSDHELPTFNGGRIPKRVRQSAKLDKIKENISLHRNVNENHNLDSYLVATSNKVRWNK